MAKPIFAGLLSFSGRRDRRSYGWLLVFMLAVQVAFIHAAIVRADSATMWLFIQVSVAVAIVHVIVLAQRLRDTGRPGMLALVLFVPVFGFWIAFILAFQRGQEGPNRYGPDPLWDPLLGRSRRK